MLTPLEVLQLYPPHEGTFWTLLASRARIAPERDGLLFQNQHWSYAELQQEVARTVAMLSRRAVRPGDRVGVMSANHPSTVFVLFALAQLGAILVPVNPDYGADEAHYILDHAEVSGVICSTQALPTVRAACARIEPAPWLMLNDGAQPGLPSYSDEVAMDPFEAASPVPDADAVCLFIYTSGSTGFPKGVMHSQRNVITAGEGFVERMYLQPDDRLLCVLPMFHINAICYSLGGALAAGATLILEPRFSASSFWRVVKDSGATEVNTIAAASSILMRRPRSEYVSGHRLRKIYGAPFDAATIQVFQQEFAVPTLIEGYGMSEVPGALNNPFAGPHKVGSMGRPSRHPDPRVPLAELRIVDDQGQPVADGEVGELVVRTPIIMKGYYRDPEQTVAAFRDGWFLTGDLAWRDADNFFWFVARKKDIIRKRGENISGAELDRVLGNHPDIVEAAALAVPSDLGEDEILVVVVLRDGANLSAQDVAAWCAQHLAPIKAPRYVVFAAALPHTPTHRVAKYRIKQDKDLLASAVDLLA